MSDLKGRRLNNKQPDTRLDSRPICGIVFRVLHKSACSQPLEVGSGHMKEMTASSPFTTNTICPSIVYGLESFLTLVIDSNAKASISSMSLPFRATVHEEKKTMK